MVSAVEGMTKALHRRGHRITILTTDTLSRTERYTGSTDELRDGIRVVRVPNLSVWLRGNLNLSTPLKMRQVTRRLTSVSPGRRDTLSPGGERAGGEVAINIVHLHEFRTLENLLALPVIPADLPVCLSPHGTLVYATGRSRLKRLWDAWLSPRIARHIQRVIGLTQQEVHDARALWPTFGGPLPQFSAIPNGIWPEEFVRLPNSRPFREKYRLGNRRVVLFMGRLHPRKGVDILVKAFKAANPPETSLVLAGPNEGMLATLTPLLDERIVLTGFISGAERLAALACASVFVLPATGEGLSMAALEAMGAGLPVILSPGCNLPEVAEAGAGFIVEPEIEPLAAALRHILSDEVTRQHQSAAARKLVLNRFTWEKVAEQIEKIYGAMVQGHGVPCP